MADFLHLYIRPKEGVSQDDLKAKINLATDWYRYSDDVYLLFTTSSIEKWKERLKPFAESGGRLFICKLEIEGRKGWMGKDFWNWIRKNVDRNASSNRVE